MIIVTGDYGQAIRAIVNCGKRVGPIRRENDNVVPAVTVRTIERVL